MWCFSKRRVDLKKINNYADGFQTLTHFTSLFIVASSTFGNCCFIGKGEERNRFRQTKQIGSVFIDFLSHSVTRRIGAACNEFRCNLRIGSEHNERCCCSNEVD